MTGINFLGGVEASWYCSWGVCRVSFFIRCSTLSFVDAILIMSHLCRLPT